MSERSSHNFCFSGFLKKFGFMAHQMERYFIKVATRFITVVSFSNKRRCASALATVINELSCALCGGSEWKDISPEWRTNAGVVEVTKASLFSEITKYYMLH